MAPAVASDAQILGKHYYIHGEKTILLFNVVPVKDLNRIFIEV